ncbi:MAG: hypothetical protein ACRDNK_07860 [Solirubrobacteraceae bacterium]
MLVVANVTATSPELINALTTRGESGPVTFTLVMPASPVADGRQAAQLRLDEALERFRTAGLQVDGRLASGDPILAVSEEWDPRRYDEIIVSTLPMRLSKWLHAGLPERIEHLTGARVTHVVSQPPKPPVTSLPAPAPEKRDSMGPLAVLSWGGAKRRS